MKKRITIDFDLIEERAMNFIIADLNQFMDKVMRDHYIGENYKVKEKLHSQHRQPEKCPSCCSENVGGVGINLRICGDCYYRWGTHQVSAQ